MLTKILLPCGETYKICAEIIKKGGIVAFPTETVYGLGADASNANAVKAVFTAKGRPQDNPLIIHIADKEDIYGVVVEVTSAAEKLMDKFMPGPITLVLKKRPCISAAATAGLETAGIRLPFNPVAREFIRACGVPVAAPSANTSTRPSPTEAAHVYEDLNGKIPAIIDGGKCDIGIESTVVDVTGDIPVVLRPGKITPEDIIKVCGSCGVSQSLAGDRVMSPGVKYKHYAPRCPAILVKGGAESIKRLYERYLAENLNPAVLCYDDTAQKLGKINIISLGGNDAEGASRLFGALRIAEKGAGIIIMEYPKGGGIGDSLLNRMKKAAGGNITE